MLSATVSTRFTDLLTRSITALVFAAIVGTTILLGRPLLAIALLGAGGTCVYELHRIYGTDRSLALAHVGIAVSASLIGAASPQCLTFFLLLECLAANSAKTSYCLPVASCWIYGGIACFLSLIAETGNQVAIAVFLLTWSTDVGAYFCGRIFGGAKLAPSISPGKTWSGFAGGLVSAIAVAAILREAEILPGGFIVGAFAGLACQAGDLYESWLKRGANVKDSGRLLPGHGGMFDRLDGMIGVAIAIWIATHLRF